MENNKCCPRCGKISTLTHCWWKCKMTHHYGKPAVPQLNTQEYWQVFKNDLYTNVHSSTIHNSQNLETTQTSISWLNKMWYIHTMKYYLATERNEVLIHVATWMNLIHIMWNERNQTHKRLRIAWFHLKETFGTDQSIETESRLVTARGWRDGEIREWQLRGVRFPLGIMKMFWNWLWC